MKYDLLHIQGKPYVLVPLHDYRAMAQVPGAEKRGLDLPDSVLDALAVAQDHPIRILRKHRGLTQAQLSKKSGVSRPYLTEIETGRKQGSLTALKNIARALEVDIGTLTA